MRLKNILIVLMALMLLTTSLFTVAFSKSVLTKETKLIHEGESPQTTQATAEDSTLNQKELNKASDVSNAKTEENLAKSRSPNIFPFDSFVKDISTGKTDMWRDLAKVDEDSAELVIGINNAQPTSYIKISDLIVENGGKLVNTVSAEGEVIAVVADLPLALVPSFVEDVQASDLARYVEPNMKYQTQLVPNDPDWIYQWGPQKIEADWAWNTTIGDPSVLVAVIDTGIDYNHPDLATNYVLLGYDWVNIDNDPIDDNGHGTHCAGIVAAELDNGIGIAGVAQVSIMAEKGLDQYGSGWEDDLANALIHAVNQGADILSNSWGAYSPSMLIYDAIQYASDNDVLVVAAAGNEATSQKLYPAAYDEVIAITATDQYDNSAWFTNFGEWVEVAAPGVDIYSTMPTYHVTLNDPPYNKNLNYDYLDGTSMATPHASGVAALIWSQFPNMTRDWVRAQLRYTADDLGEPGFDEYYGFGRINAGKAVEQAPPDHDLLIFNWEKPGSIQPGDHVSFNATVLNFGANDENDVTVQILVDGNLTDSTFISYLANGTATTVSLSWSPSAEGTYNVTLYIVPVLGETAIENNVVSAMVLVRYAVFVLWDDVHDGDGDSLTGNYLSLYELLTSNGFVVDELTTGTINSGLLASYDILVLIDPEYNFLSSEITDIHNWVATGGALIIIPDAGYPSTLAQIMAPYSVQLTGWDTYYGTTTNIISHPITWDVGSIYYDRAWELEVTFPCEALAWSLENYAFLSVTGNEVVVLSDSNIMDNYGLGMADNTQLMLNIFSWIGVRYEHELTVYLDAPPYLVPSESSLLNATVHNRGLNNETNVELQLLINGTVVESETVPLLVNGTFHTIDYPWTPTTAATYNVTAYAPPVPDENITTNNIYSTFVTVKFASRILAYVQYTDYYQEYANALAAIDSTFGPAYILTELWDYTQLDSMLPENDILLIPEQEYSYLSMMQTIGATWSETLSNFLGGGGVIIVCDHSGGSHGILTGAGLMSISSVNYITGWTVYLVDPTDPLASGVSSSFIAPNGALSFVTDETNVVFDDGTYPVLIHKKVGQGHIALIGFDYYASNPDADQILGNAVGLALYMTISISPSAGSPGTEVAVTGIKAAANGAVEIYWNETFIENATADAVGSFTYLLTVPLNATAGAHEITAVDVTTGETSSRTFRVIFITIDPISGPIGTKVTANGAGFSSHNQVLITFNDMLLGYAMTDDTGNFTFVFNIPVSAAGPQTVKAFDAEANYAGTTFTVIDVTPLDVEIDVGAIHFRGELAEFYAQITFKGVAVDATYINALLYKPDGTTEALTVSPPIATGFYKITYAIPVDARTGTYALNIEASYTTTLVEANGTSFKGFLLSPTLTGWNALLININGTVGTIKTDLGAIELKLDDINATLKSVEGRMGTIETDIGTIKADVGVINAVITSIEGRMAIIGSDLGTIKTDINSIHGRLTSIEGNVATIETEIGTIKTDIKSINANIIAIDGTLATIQTDIGTIVIDIADIQLKLTAIDGNITTIQTTLGTIQTSLDDINATIVDIRDDLVTINTTLGEIHLSLDDVSLKLISIQGDIEEGVATITGAITDAEDNILTELGEVEVKLDAINATLTSIEGRLATIETDIGTINGAITSIQGDVATIETDIGTIKAMLEGWTGGTTSSIVTPEGTFQILVLTTSALEGPIAFSDNVVALTLSGPSGTAGTTNIVIPKQLLVGIESSINEVVVTIDDEQVVFTYTEQPEAYVLSITYTHSTHKMKIYLAGLLPTPVSWVLYVIVTAIIVLAVSASLAIYILKIRKPRVANTK